MHSGTFWNILEHSGTFWNILSAVRRYNFNLGEGRRREDFRTKRCHVFKVHYKFVFIHFLKTKTFFKVFFHNINQKSIYIKKVLMLDRQFGGLIGKLFWLGALLFVEKTKV